MKTIVELDNILDNFLDNGKCNETQVDKYLYIKVDSVITKSGTEFVAYLIGKVGDKKTLLRTKSSNGTKNKNWNLVPFTELISKLLFVEYAKLTPAQMAHPAIFNAWRPLSAALDLGLFQVVTSAVEQAIIPEELETFRQNILAILP